MISIKGAELENNTFSQVLDEINLAPSDLLQRIQGLIERSYLPWVLQLGFVHGFFSAPFVWRSGELPKGVEFIPRSGTHLALPESGNEEVASEGLSGGFDELK